VVKHKKGRDGRIGGGVINGPASDYCFQRSGILVAEGFGKLVKILCHRERKALNINGTLNSGPG